MGEAKTVAGHVKRTLGELGLLDAKKVSVRVCCHLDAHDNELEVCPFVGDWLLCRHPDAKRARPIADWTMLDGDQQVLNVPDWCPLRSRSIVISLHPDAK